MAGITQQRFYTLRFCAILFYISTTEGQMDKQVTDYSNLLKDNIKLQISIFLRSDNAQRIAQEAFLFLFDKNYLDSQEYYFEYITNREKFLSTGKYFRDFKQKYSLQGIDGKYLDNLEFEKEQILNLIDHGELNKLYFDYFAHAKLQNKDKYNFRNLGSFFAKLVHTFCPDRYCALDNPIKDYFGLRKDSFFLSFIVISQAYQEWVNDNYLILKIIRNEFDNHPIARSYSAKVTNLKLLDMLFWYQTNIICKKSRKTLFEVFINKPPQWGLRGDPYLWEEMNIVLENHMFPDTEEEFILIIEEAYKQLTNKSTKETDSIFVERYSHGGMSTGIVSPRFWREIGIPLLLSGYREKK